MWACKSRGAARRVACARPPVASGSSHPGSSRYFLCFLGFGFGTSTSVTATFVPFARTAPRPGDELLTTSLRSLRCFGLRGWWTLPSLQWARESAERAWESVLPFSFGTTHFGLGGGGGDVTVTGNVVEVELPAASVAVSVTVKRPAREYLC